jgi:hypothetical protein
MQHALIRLIVDAAEPSNSRFPVIDLRHSDSRNNCANAHFRDNKTYPIYHAALTNWRIPLQEQTSFVRNIRYEIRIGICANTSKFWGYCHESPMVT